MAIKSDKRVRLPLLEVKEGRKGGVPGKGGNEDKSWGKLEDTFFARVTIGVGIKEGEVKGGETRGFRLEKGRITARLKEVDVGLDTGDKADTGELESLD